MNQKSPFRGKVRLFVDLVRPTDRIDHISGDVVGVVRVRLCCLGHLVDTLGGSDRTISDSIEVVDRVRDRRRRGVGVRVGSLDLVYRLVRCRSYLLDGRRDLCRTALCLLGEALDLACDGGESGGRLACAVGLNRGAQREHVRLDRVTRHVQLRPDLRNGFRAFSCEGWKRLFPFSSDLLSDPTVPFEQHDFRLISVFPLRQLAYTSAGAIYLWPAWYQKGCQTTTMATSAFATAARRSTRSTI